MPYAHEKKENIAHFPTPHKLKRYKVFLKNSVVFIDLLVRYLIKLNAGRFFFFFFG